MTNQDDVYVPPSPTIEDGHPDRESEAYSEAFDLIQEAITRLEPICRDVVAAFFDIVADHAIRPGDSEARDRFMRIAIDAADSAYDGTSYR